MKIAQVLTVILGITIGATVLDSGTFLGEKLIDHQPSYNERSATNLGRVVESPRQGIQLGESNESPKQFKRRVYEEILSVDTRGIDPLLILTVATLETGEGTGKIFRRTNNLFSIRHAKDFRNGHSYLPDGTIIFGSEIESIRLFIRLLCHYSQYHVAYTNGTTGNAIGFFQGLQDGGYAEDSHYARSLNRVYRELLHEQVATRFRLNKNLDDHYCVRPSHQGIHRPINLGNSY